MAGALTRHTVKEQRKQMENILFSYDHIILVAKYQTPQEHRHFAKHLLFSIDQDLECTVNGQIVTGRGICIASDVPHTARTVSGQMLVLLIEATSAFSERLDAVLGKEPCRILDDPLAGEVVKAYEAGALPGVRKAVFRAFEVEQQDSAKYDGRIREVLRILSERESIDADIFAQLYTSTGLSQSRLSHLFKEQVKVSLSSYIALIKMQKASKYVLEGKNMTTAALHAGFSSSAHMAATCKRMFGISLSEIFAAC